MDQLHHSNYYQKTAERVLEILHASKKGLPNEEISSRILIYGKNTIASLHRINYFLKFLQQFLDPLIILLFISGLISLYLEDYRASTIIFVLLFINVGIGFMQEFKAERLMDSLQDLMVPKARVIRSGNQIEVNSEELVPGDIVSIEEGDAVPADLRILTENNLSANDFALTGESNPVRKFSREIPAEVELGDRNNLVFMGTTVATGNCFGIVIGTGLNTELGKIARLSHQTVTDPSPLQKEMINLAEKLTIGTLILGSILTGLALYARLGIKESFLFAVGIASAMIPQGLPAQVNIALSQASNRLARNKAIVKKLSAVETMGATTVICTDKTGTLTTNQMTVQKFMIGKDIFTATGNGYESVGEILNSKRKIILAPELRKYELFFLTGFFASNARISPPDKEHLNWYCLGDPTEGALIALGNKAGFDNQKLEEKYPELLEFSFDSVRKRMSSIRKYEGEYYSFLKGSPESILNNCTHLWDNGKVRKITAADITAIKKYDDREALQAHRNIGYAYKILPSFSKNIKIEEAEQGLIFLGVASMIDPPRATVKYAMEAAHKANIRVIMITGDYALTAEAIAKKVGLEQDGKLKIIVGEELRKMSDIDVLKNIQASNIIFSRTSPEDKLRIVELLEKNHEIVAVTGDGVNDAPALKKADIGVAMGRTGTDVAKQSAEIVLMDDSFSTLVYAIKEGRVIFQNLKKTIISCLTSNGGELFVVLFSLAGATLFGIPLAISAILILAVDLVGEMFPLTALTWDPPLQHLMTEKPRNTRVHLVNFGTAIDLLKSGLLMGGLAYLNFILLFYFNNKNPIGFSSLDPFYFRATALTYVSILFVQFANILSRRAGRRNSIFSSYLWSNKRLLIAFGISIFCVLNIVYNPLVSYYFATAPLALADWLMAITAGLIYLGSRELGKYWLRRKEANAILAA